MKQWLDGRLNSLISLLKGIFPCSDILALFDESVERAQFISGLLLGSLGQTYLTTSSANLFHSSIASRAAKRFSKSLKVLAWLSMSSRSPWASFTDGVPDCCERRAWRDLVFWSMVAGSPSSSLESWLLLISIGFPKTSLVFLSDIEENGTVCDRRLAAAHPFESRPILYISARCRFNLHRLT